MNPNRTIVSEEMSGLVDRLVCGELDETARGRILAWLEEDPVRWRLCGLAFLEAQTWSNAFGALPAASAGPMLRPAVEGLARPIVARLRHPASRRVLAGLALLSAFVLGLAVRDVVVRRLPPVDQTVARQESPPAHDHQASAGASPQSHPEQEPLLAALDVQTGGRLGPTTPIRIPVIPARADQTQDARRSVEIPDYVRQQWERRGYKVSCERRFLFARLPNGQPIVVPVEQLNVNPTPLHIN